MANISQNVNIEMLEKLPDGTYKRKYPKTRSDTGVTFDEHLAESTQQAHLAKNIGLEDTEGNFVATEVEGAMNELFTNVSNGKSLVGGAITDVDDSVVIPTDPTFQELASAISGISTGKKWASGTIHTTSGFIEVRGLDFKPSFIIVITAQSSRTYRKVYSGNTVLDNYRITNYGEISDQGGWDIYLDGFRTKIWGEFSVTASYYAFE